MFDKEFVHTGKLSRNYSKMFHKIFDIRQEADYKEFTEILHEDAENLVNHAKEFLEAVRNLLDN